MYHMNLKNVVQRLRRRRLVFDRRLAAAVDAIPEMVRSWDDLRDLSTADLLCFCKAKRSRERFEFDVSRFEQIGASV